MLMRHIELHHHYLTPEIVVYYAEIELGFAGSLLEDPVVNPEQNW